MLELSVLRCGGGETPLYINVWLPLNWRVEMSGPGTAAADGQRAL